MTTKGADFDYEKLSDYLKALANPNRLELLYQLRFPHTASEVFLTPKRSETGGNPDRFISRQAVERHLDVLHDVGVVITQRGVRESRPVDEYVVNHAMLFAMVEELRKLTTIKAHATVDPLVTRGADPAPTILSTPQVKGPRLVLVGGVFEGRAFPLQPKPDGSAEWVVGRREGVDVRLDYDPFVSSENTRIVLKDGRYFVEDLVSSRNGTLLNYQPMPRGSRAPLETGDLVGVGRSVLLFRGS